TRQLSNLRTVTTALEAYRVDNTSYPACTHTQRPGSGRAIKAPPGVDFSREPSQWKVYPGFEGYSQGITTPIAYLSSDDALMDIFRLGHNFNDKLMEQMMYLPTHFYVDVPGTHEKQLARYG